jgi:DNA-binding CsgD family transcriptional regulator
LFGLSRREAELALALGSGEQLVDAAQRMNLKTETARGYSKAIYAKMNVRGQSELIVRLLTSSAWLS